MRFFYVHELKNYIVFPALAALLLTFIIQLTFPPLLKIELSALDNLRYQLGYLPAYYTGTTLRIFPLLFSILYGFIAGLLGVFVFRIKYLHAGYTLYTTNRFHFIIAIVYFFFIFVLLHADMFNHTDQILTSPIKLVRSMKFPIFNIFPNGPIVPPNSPPTQPNQGQPPPQSTSPYPTATAVTSAPPPPPGVIIEPDKMPSAQEAYAEVNAYRQRNGRSTLAWDNTLANFAQTRASYQSSVGKLDDTGGLADYVRAHGEYALGYRFASEIDSYGVPESAKYLVENMYSLQNDALLSPRWTNVGIGVAGKATAVVFGGNQP